LLPSSGEKSKLTKQATPLFTPPTHLIIRLIFDSENRSSKSIAGQHKCHKENIESLMDASKEAGLEVNAEKNKYILLSCQQNAEQNHDIKTANRSFENVAQFRYFGTTITNQYFIQEEIKRRLNLSNACYHSVQNFFFSSAV
jgi:hypothetical protein